MITRWLKRKTSSNHVEEPDLGPLLPVGTMQTVSGFINPNSIPSMPSAARQAFELSLNPGAEVRDFVALIEHDEALASRIVKIANSVYYDRGNSSRGIEESVITMGLNEVRGLLQSTSLSQVFPSPSPIRAFLWSHDVATALIARRLALETGSGFGDICFLAGLMHDIGKLLLLNRYPDHYVQIVDKVRKLDISFQEAELDTFPFSHTEAGVLLAEQWKFAPEMARAIRDHHLPWEDSRSRAPVTAFVKAADLLAHCLGFGHLSGFQSLRATSEEQMKSAWSALEISPADAERIRSESRELVELESDKYSSGVSG